jgi:hypothetical protein
LEELLRVNLVASVGKELSAADFSRYMIYHNAVFKDDHCPKAFCFNIRCEEHSPEGVLSLECRNDDDGCCDPVHTFVSQSLISQSQMMRFSIDSSAKISFVGNLFVHGLMMHKFETDNKQQQQQQLILNARSRNFSCFLILIGRISGAGLFDPQFGIICQNKDEISIPLVVETIPSAAEFKVSVLIVYF